MRPKSIIIRLCVWCVYPHYPDEKLRGKSDVYSRKECCGSGSYGYVFGPPESGSVSQSKVLNLIRILLSSSKNSKKNLDSFCFVT
jgi:hypothetical protein